MFDSLTNRISEAFGRFSRTGRLRETDLDAALGEIRRALIEADVALPVIRGLVSAVRASALGAEVLKGLRPSDVVIKAMHDALVEALGESAPLLAASKPPTVIMLVGLQGSGKTTTAAKLALWHKNNGGKRVLLASLDTSRPAAMQQLQVLGERNDIATLPIVAAQGVREIARRALDAARLGGFDAVILDTAGRGHTDADLMQEISQLHKLANPHEVLMVADAMTGQEAARIASEFSSTLPLTGAIMTRMDADARGGAVLSMYAVAKVPIKFIGVGEKVSGLEIFHPDRVARRILGQGDVLSLVEKAASEIDQGKAEQAVKRLQAGRFTLDDMADQFRNMNKMGGLKSIAAMLPGMGKMSGAMAAQEKNIGKQLAIIQSMTRSERANPQLFNASRKHRVARGSGVAVSEVNKLLKTHRKFADIMRRSGKAGGLTAPAADDADMLGALTQGAPPDLSALSSGGGGLAGMGGGLGMGGGAMDMAAAMRGMGAVSKRRAAKALKKPKRRR